MSTIFIDTCILIQCLEKKGDQVGRFLSHLTNAGHSLFTSISVVGEMIHICLKKHLDHEHLVSIIERLRIEILFPASSYPSIMSAVEKTLAEKEIWGSSTTDRMHLIFAIIKSIDFFVTTSGEVRSLGGPYLDVHWPRVLSLQSLHDELL
jgi:predicted nucleic acid-binding protein